MLLHSDSVTLVRIVCDFVAWECELARDAILARLLDEEVCSV